jgi:hypothetical protein
MDLIQLVLMIGACYACYIRGKRDAAIAIFTQLEAAGVVKIQHEEEQEEN